MCFLCFFHADSHRRPHNYFDVKVFVSSKSVDRKSTRLNSSHVRISYAVSCLKKKMADALLGTQCPHVLYPYALQMISDPLQAHASPPFLLQPLTFHALYAESLREREQQGEQRQGLSSSSETAGNA